MYMLKFLFQKVQSWLLGKQPTSWGTAKDYPLGTNWRHPDLCVPGRDRRPSDQTVRLWEQLTAQDRNVAASFI